MCACLTNALQDRHSRHRLTIGNGENRKLEESAASRRPQALRRIPLRTLGWILRDIEVICNDIAEFCEFHLSFEAKLT